MWVAFAVQKLLIFFQQNTKHIRILYVESTKTVNEMTLNEFVKLTTLWTTETWSLGHSRIMAGRHIAHGAAQLQNMLNVVC